MPSERSSRDVRPRFLEKNSGTLHSPLAAADINRSIGGTKTPLRVQRRIERIQNKAASNAITAANLRRLRLEENNGGRKHSLFASSEIQRSIGGTKTPARVERRLERMRLEKLRSEATTTSTAATSPAPLGVGSDAETPCPPRNDGRLAKGECANGHPDSQVLQTIAIASPVVRKRPSRRPNKSFFLPPAEEPIDIAAKVSIPSTFAQNRAMLAFPFQKPVRCNYGTQSRTMLLSQVQDAEAQDPAQHDDFADAKSQQLVNKRPMEPNTSDLHYPEDSPRLCGPQEDNVWVQLGRTARASAPTNSQVKRSHSARHRSEQSEGEDEVGTSYEQEERLEELGIEILAVAGDGGSTSSCSLSVSPKRRQDLASHWLRETAQLQNGGSEDDSEEDLDQHVPAKKRRTGRRIPSVEAQKAALRELNGRRASKVNVGDGEVQEEVMSKREKSKKKNKPEKLKKKPRRLPVDELPVVGERPYESDLEMASSPPLELSQDPISQISDAQTDDDGENNRGHSIILKIKVHPRKCFGNIDTSKFRIPEPIHPDQPCFILQTPFQADGFDGKEAEPIGRLMPVKQTSRRTQSYHKVAIRLKELTIVNDKSSETPKKGPQKQRKSDDRPWKSKGANTKLEEVHMLMDIQEVDREQGHQIVQTPDPASVVSNLQTPIITTDQNQSSSTSAGNSSPLQHKSQNIPRRGTRTPDMQIKAKPLSQRPSAGRRQDGRVSEPLNTAYPPKRSEKQIQDDMIASQEISQVTMKRPARDNNRGDGDRRGHVYLNVENANGKEPAEDNEGSSEEDVAFLTSTEDESEDEQETPPSADVQPDHSSTAENIHASANDQQQTNIVVYEEEDVDSEPQREGTLAPTPIKSQFLEDELNSNWGPQKLQDIAKMILEINQVTKSTRAKRKDKQPAAPARIPTSARNILRATPKESRSNQNAFSRTPTTARSIVKAPRKQGSLSQQPIQFSDDPDSSWRPRVPDTRGPDMQVDEEIVDSPTPPQVRERAAFNRLQSLRRWPTIGNQPLHTVKKRPESPSQDILSAVTHDSQRGSIVLGNTQNFALHSFNSTVPETQLQRKIQSQDEPEVQETQVAMTADTRYFSQASRHLSASVLKSKANRTHSMLAHVHFARQQQEGGDSLMAGIITMSAPFQHTVSSIKTSSAGQPSPMQQTSIQSQRSLRELTRQASMGMGTPTRHLSLMQQTPRQNQRGLNELTTQTSRGMGTLPGSSASSRKSPRMVSLHTQFRNLSQTGALGRD